MKTNNNPKITVITVTYNAEKYLEQTIRNIMELDYSNIEYIIIDGKSTDRTINIIKQYEKHITHWISESDSGIYDAMNKGIDLATGEWINFMNAGDIFTSKDIITKLFKQKNKDTDLICGNIYYYNDLKEKILKKAGGEKKIFDGSFAFCCHQALFAKTSLLKKYKFSIQYLVAADYEFMIKCYYDKCKYQFVELPVAIYLNEGFSKQNQILGRIEELHILTRYLKNLNEIFYYSPFKRLIKLSDKTSLIPPLINSLEIAIRKLELDKKKFVMYGFGNIGQMIYHKYKQNIIEIIDKNYDSLNEEHPEIKIKNLCSIRNLQFQYVLITPLGYESEIKDDLKENYFIPDDKILMIPIK